MIKFLIDFKTAGTRFLGRPGGMRRPLGGTLGRSKNTAEEDMQQDAENLCYALGKSWPLLRLRSVIRHAVTSPLRGGRRIDFPKGDHRRPPAFFHSAIYGKAFGILGYRRP